MLPLLIPESDRFSYIIYFHQKFTSNMVPQFTGYAQLFQPYYHMTYQLLFFFLQVSYHVSQHKYCILQEKQWNFLVYLLTNICHMSKRQPLQLNRFDSINLRWGDCICSLHHRSKHHAQSRPWLPFNTVSLKLLIISPKLTCGLGREMLL